jgi:uncharacterized protein GlcG (DUF336 family)
MSGLTSDSQLTPEIIQSMLKAALKKAEELGRVSAVAIVDSGGHLLGFLRPGGSRFVMVSMAIQKAWTAIGGKMPTEQFAGRVQPGAPGYGCNITDPRILPVIGGLPITKDGVTFIGGIGASGGTGEEDRAVAAAGIIGGGFDANFEDYDDRGGRKK